MPLRGAVGSGFSRGGPRQAPDVFHASLRRGPRPKKLIGRRQIARVGRELRGRGPSIAPRDAAAGLHVAGRGHSFHETVDLLAHSKAPLSVRFDLDYKPTTD